MEFRGLGFWRGLPQYCERGEMHEGLPFELAMGGCGVRFECLWFMVCGLWFMVYGLWFMVYGLWFMVYGLGFACKSTTSLCITFRT